MPRRRPVGFTMIELMIVVAIIGILSAIALPKFADMLEKSREGATKGNAGVIKSANSIYYGDNQGVWPGTLNTISQYRYSLYLDQIVPVKVTGKFDPNVLGGCVPSGTGVTMAISGMVPGAQSTGWMYDSTDGKVYVNSTLLDSKRIAYSFYGFE